MSTSQQQEAIYTANGPPVQSFPIHELAQQINTKVDGKKRKSRIENLEECKLMEMVQYNCSPKGKEVECKPLLRLFRRCADGLTVETTEWEFTR